MAGPAGNQQVVELELDGHHYTFRAPIFRDKGPLRAEAIRNGGRYWTRADLMGLVRAGVAELWGIAGDDPSEVIAVIDRCIVCEIAHTEIDVDDARTYDAAEGVVFDKNLSYRRAMAEQGQYNENIWIACVTLHLLSHRNGDNAALNYPEPVPDDILDALPVGHLDQLGGAIWRLFNAPSVEEKKD